MHKTLMQKFLNILGNFFFQLIGELFLFKKNIDIYMRTFPYSVRNGMALFMQENFFHSFTIDVFE